MLKIGNIALKSNIICGPMAGISNLVYREIAIEHGASLCYAEMVSDKALCFDNKKTKEMLTISKSEHPVSMQLFGGEVETMIKAAKIIDKECDCDIIDINMGCPVPKVLKAGAGSKLLLDPNKAYEIVKGIVDNVDKPVTVKLRIGFDEAHINIVEMAKLMEKAGVSAIAVHARTRAQMYEGKARWEYIKQVKEAVKIPVIGNGDVYTIYDAKRMIEETGCDGVMIARGGIGNPWLFKNSIDYIEKNIINKEPTVKEKIDMCIEQAERLVTYYQDELAALKEMRTLVGYYFRGFDGAAKLRGKLNQITTINELKSILGEIEV